MKTAVAPEIHRLQQVRRLTEVNRAATNAASIDEVFQLTVDHAADLLVADKSLLLVTDDEGLLALRSSHGLDAAQARRFRAPFNEALISSLTELFDPQRESFLGVPFVVSGAVRGILVVIRPPSSTGAADDEWLLSALADQAAIALEKTRLGEIGEFREQLIGIIGHDLRSPLSTVLMSAHILLQSKGLGENEAELARRISSSAATAARLIDQLLDLTRSRLGGGIPIDPKPLDMNEVCRQVIGETELTSPDRLMRLKVEGDVTGVWDRDRMYQLLANVVGNAVQHGEPRSPIDLQVAGGAIDVVIDVTNRGAPIPPESLPFIFDAFRQGRADSRTRASGLGLGLFIAQQIARSHGGAIAVTSSASHGTTFRVRLPRGAVAAPPGSTSLTIPIAASGSTIGNA